MMFEVVTAAGDVRKLRGGRSKAVGSCHSQRVAAAAAVMEPTNRKTAAASREKMQRGCNVATSPPRAGAARRTERDL